MPAVPWMEKAAEQRADRLLALNQSFREFESLYPSLEIELIKFDFFVSAEYICVNTVSYTCFTHNLNRI